MGAPKVVLLVEDNEDDAQLAQRAFRRADLKATLELVRDGAEAMEYLEARGRYLGKAVPALVLLDLKLPLLDGHEVLHRIRHNGRTRRLPVIVLTSSIEESDVGRSYDEGVNSYLRKPVQFDSFVDAAKDLGHYWLSLNQPPPDVRE